MAAPSLRSMEARLRAVEARLADIEGPYAETLYQLRRESVESKIERGFILEHLGLPRATAQQIDAVLDEES